jgi:hypothetical protein
VDVDDVHMPLLTPEAAPTEHVAALCALVQARGPYALVVVDPLARISGASIDGDNVAACALITALESIATAAGGLVLGVHHTSQTARRTGLVDATAVRGATGLGDSARMVLVLTSEEIEHGDAGIDARLGEIVTVTRAKANHVGRWEPLQARRGDHGVLTGLDSYDRDMLAAAKAGATPSAKREADRTARTTARHDREGVAVVDVVRSRPGIATRDLRAEVMLTLRVGAAAAAGAIDRAVAAELVRAEDGPRNSRLHYPSDRDS